MKQTLSPLQIEIEVQHVGIQQQTIAVRTYPTIEGATFRLQRLQATHSAGKLPTNIHACVILKALKRLAALGRDRAALFSGGVKYEVTSFQFMANVLTGKHRHPKRG